MKRPLLKLTVLLFLLSGCVTRSYYVSPMYGTTASYHTMPLQKDSTKNALYLNSGFNLGSANYHSHDDVFCFQSSIYNVNSVFLKSGMVPDFRWEITGLAGMTALKTLSLIQHL